MKLIDCIQPLLVKEVIGNTKIEIKGIQIDSRQVMPGDLFVALRGGQEDGHDFLHQAILRGASAVLVEKKVNVPVPSICVPDARRALAVVATTFYQHPTKELKLIGVTGTNGKTTTSYMIERILQTAGYPTGLIGTMHTKILDQVFPAKNTTPESVELQRIFRLMREAGCQYAVIEASSHALAAGRTHGSHFHMAVFTNITHEHLDYHQTMESYRHAKELLFSQLDQQNYAVLNGDDPHFYAFYRSTSAQVIRYGLQSSCDVWAENIHFGPNGTSFMLHTLDGSIDIQLKLVGQFNVYNALAAVSVVMLEGIPLPKIKEGLQAIWGVPGRMEKINEGQPYTVLVDFAHTPDGLENVLSAIRQWVEGRVICVIGCDGDRDRTKRPYMGQIASQYSDFVVFTSVNPRTEDPDEIIREMIQGVPKENYVVRVDRRQAIEEAIQYAKPNDVVLLAGKGHETYQEIDGVRYDFDDRQVAREILGQQFGS